jgi:hypothetical protein
MKIEKTNYSEQDQQNEYTNPIDFFNNTYQWDRVTQYVKGLEPCDDVHYTTKPGVKQFVVTKDHIEALEVNALDVPVGTKLTKFQLLALGKFRNNWRGAGNWVEHTLQKKQVLYVRIGTDYYKRIEKYDAWNNASIQLDPWKKDTLKDDYGKFFLKDVQAFDNFCIEPNNLDYVQIKNNSFNLYSPFTWKPEKGDAPVSHNFMKHIFGDQIDLGYIYMKVLYTMPKQMLPVLSLVSTERHTGKTTFLNWLNIIFGHNFINLNPDELNNPFNAAYATKNIIGIDETIIDKQSGIEKLKSITTAKMLTVNPKYVNSYTIPFFGKVILCTNKEVDFMRIDQEEIRFWIRKLKTIVADTLNTNIEADLEKEIPAFLYYLLHEVPEIDTSKSRMIFTIDQIQNEELQRTKDESRSGLYKDLTLLITQWFESNLEETELLATPTHLKDMWFNYNAKVSHSYLVKVLKNEFKMQPEKMQRFIPFNGKSNDKVSLDNVSGKPYKFIKSDFTDATNDDENNRLPF